MKITNLLLICSSYLIIQSCNSHSDKKFITEYKITNRVANDSLVEVCKWLDSTSADCFLINKNDTVDHYLFDESDEYHNYVHFKNNKIYKIRLFIFVRNRWVINEIIHLDENGNIQENESTYLKTKLVGESLEFFNPSPKTFDKLKILIGDKNTFDKLNWISPDTLVAFGPSLNMPLKYRGRKCIFQTITTNANGEEVGGQDYYFDIDNLLQRDMAKSLIDKNPSGQK